MAQGGAGAQDQPLSQFFRPVGYIFPPQALKNVALFSFQMDRTWTDRETMYISYIGKLFLRMLKALILPLIIPSLIAAVGSLDMSLSGKVSGK